MAADESNSNGFFALHGTRADCNQACERSTGNFASPGGTCDYDGDGDVAGRRKFDAAVYAEFDNFHD